MSDEVNEEETDEEETEDDEEEEATAEVQEAAPGPNAEATQVVSEGTQAVVLKLKQDQTPAQKLELKLDYVKTNALKMALRITKALGSEDVTCKYDGNLHIRQMNSSRTTLIDAVIDMGAGLEKLEQPSAPQRTFTVNIGGFLRFLKDSQPQLNIDQADMIIVDKRYNGTVTATLPLLEDSDETIPDPKMPLGISASLNLDEIMTGLRRLSEEPESLNFIAENGSLTIKGGNSQMQKIEFSQLKTDMTSANGQAGYALPLLKALGKATYKISYATDMPMKAIHVITTTEYEGTKSVDKRVGIITVWMAPRILQE